MVGQYTLSTAADEPFWGMRTMKEAVHLKGTKGDGKSLPSAQLCYEPKTEKLICQMAKICKELDNVKGKKFT